MFIQLLLSALKSNRIFIGRQFRNTARHFKDVQEIRQEASDIAKDEPVKYSTSGAGKWKAIYSTSGEDYFKTPRIQPLVVVMSLTAFMIYFCILREENDIDDWLRQLDCTVPIRVEETQLRAEIEHNKKSGIDVSWKEARLKEIITHREKIENNK